MTFVPDIVPMLSSGKHRSPRSGGCFMEIASFLSGERWSDHPKCTDPTLAELGRCVNDAMPEDMRFLLAPMIPSVIGTGGRSRPDQVHIAALVVHDCALVALPLVTVKTRPLACALLVAERLLGANTDRAVAALATHPDAWEFAQGFLRENPGPWMDSHAYLTLAAPKAVRCAVQTVSEELGADAPEVLVKMLGTAIDTTRAACGLEDDGDVSDRQWRKACDLVGAMPLGTAYDAI